MAIQVVAGVRILFFLLTTMMVGGTGYISMYLYLQGAMVSVIEIEEANLAAMDTIRESTVTNIHMMQGFALSAVMTQINAAMQQYMHPAKYSLEALTDGYRPSTWEELKESHELMTYEWRWLSLHNPRSVTKYGITLLSNTGPSSINIAHHSKLDLEYTEVNNGSEVDTGGLAPGGEVRWAVTSKLNHLPSEFPEQPCNESTAKGSCFTTWGHTTWSSVIIDGLQRPAGEVYAHPLQEHDGMFAIPLSISFTIESSKSQTHPPMTSRVKRVLDKCIHGSGSFENNVLHEAFQISINTTTLCDGMHPTPEGDPSPDDCAALCCNIEACTGWQWGRVSGCYIGRPTGCVRSTVYVEQGKMRLGWSIDAPSEERTSPVNFSSGSPGAVKGVATLYLDAIELSSILANLSSSSLNNTVLYMTQGPVLVAVSTGVPFRYRKTKYLRPFPFDTEHATPHRMYAHDTEHPLIRSHAVWVEKEGGFHKYSSTPECQETLTRQWSSGGHNYYVTCHLVTLNFKGPTYLVIALAPFDDVNALTEKITKETKWLEVNAAKKEADLKEKNYGTVAAVIFLAVLGGLISLIYSRELCVPLRTLQDQMQSVGFMNLESCCSMRPKTHFKEIHSMFTSFQDMASTLLTYRPYLPHAVLANITNPEMVVPAQELSTEPTVPRLSSKKAVGLLYVWLPGFSANAGALSNEDIQVLSNQYLNAIFQASEKHGGVIKSFNISSALVTFGAAKEVDSPVHAACDCVAEMQKRMSDVLQLMRHRLGMESPIDLYMAIDWRTMMAGPLGTQQHQVFSVFGETSEKGAQLLEACRAAQGAVCTEVVHDFVQHRFRFRKMEHDGTVYYILGERISSGASL
eukprot:Sspe_Gene.20206::Locus_7416_Transcript_1_1_Confidence_1.000_Length_2631::g.20206::m.20206